MLKNWNKKNTAIWFHYSSLLNCYTCVLSEKIELKKHFRWLCYNLLQLEAIYMYMLSECKGIIQILVLSSGITGNQADVAQSPARAYTAHSRHRSSDAD